MDKLSVLLIRLGRRLRLRDGWLLSQRSLWMACLGMALVQVAGRIWPVANLAWWTLVPLLAWLLVVAGLALLRPLPPARVARRIDTELALKERLATAWMLSQPAGRLSIDTGHRAYAAPLATLQQQDALAVAQTIDPRRALPLHWLHRPLLLAGTLAALTVALTVLPNRMDVLLTERAAIAEAAEEQARRIEELAQQLEAAEELTPEEREALLRQLEALVKQLRDNRGDRQEALADLSQIEEQLRQKLDPDTDARQAALDALAAQLQALATGQETREKADPADMDETLQALAEKLGAMSQAEREAAVQALAQMAARAAQSGNMDLAQALAALAPATQSGDADSAQRAADAAQAASAAMAQAQANLDAQAALQRALAQVQSSRQAIAQAGQGQGQGQGNQGQGQGQGQGNQGQGQGGQGTKARTLPPGTGTGQANRPQGDGPRAGVDNLDQQVYVPWERLQGQGEELVIPGQDSGQGETQTRERRDPLPGAPGQALVPYHEVYYQYLDTANQTMDQSAIPTGLKDYVRAYFSNLEP
ncbi:MAG: hypothetical protein JXA89_22445 [Anaerolineae bacterium]|nr:hypothetical protein [Anaerolineae bacterium]